MSVLSKKELGPNEKAFKYQFSLQILKLKCQIPLPCTIRFMWRRNAKSIETKLMHEVKTGPVELMANQKLSSISTVIYNFEKREFLPKESEIIVNMLFNGSPKKLANYQLDMRSILDSLNHKASRSQTFDVLLNTSIRTARDCRMTYRLSCIFKQEVIPSDKSIGATLSMSGFSSQDNKLFQRKYELPSKDNHSVASYTPSIVRYPSSTKKEKDDSSIKKYQYGPYTTSLKSNDYDLKSIGRSMENKTQINQPSSLNRQLSEEQNRRSKAEAELAKNSIEIQQLKKKISQLAIQNMKQKQSQQSLDKQSVLRGKAVSDLNHQLQLLRSQFTKVENDKNIFHRQILRLRDLQSKYNTLYTEKNKITEQNIYLQQQYEDSIKNLQRIQADRASSPNKLLPQINELQRRLNDSQLQLQRLRQRNYQLQSENQKITRSTQDSQKQQIQLKQQLRKAREQLTLAKEDNFRAREQITHARQQMFKSTVSNVSLTTNEHQKLFRQSLQLQIELKFANDELTRLRGLQQQFQGERWRVQKQQSQREEVQKQLERVQRELVGKSRGLLIEVQKTKMMGQQLREQQQVMNEMREQIQRSRNIIYHGEKQVAQMEQHIRVIEEQIGMMKHQNILLQTQIRKVEANSGEVRILQEKIAELQSRNAEKLESLESMNRNHILLNNQVKQHQKRNQQLQRNQERLHKDYLTKQREFQIKQKYYQQQQQRGRDAQRLKQSLQSQLNKISHEKKLLEKRNEMVMEQMHVMKKRFEQEKTRSLSLTRNEDLSKVRTLEMELEKRDKLASKLTKEKLQLEEENVKVNVQVMKLISQLQKVKQAKTYGR